MQNKDLEQGLRDRIYNHEEPVDTDQLWLDVQAGLHPEKKRRGLIWWWLPGLLLVGSLGWFAFNELAGDRARAQDASPVEQQGEATPLAADPEAFVGTEAATVNPDPVTATTREAGFSDNSKNTSTNAAPGFALSVPSTAPAAAPKKSQAAVSSRGSDTNTTVVTRLDNLAEVRRQATAVPQIALLPVAMLPNRFYDPTTPPFSELKDPACPVFTRRRKAQWSIGVVGMGSKPKRKITAVSNENNGQMLRNLKVERPLNALTGQLLAGYETGSGFSLRSGLSYSRINSVAEVTLDTTITTIGTGITEVIINGPGDTTFITGVVERRIHTTGTTRFYNRLSTLDVPILLGKTFRAGKWRFGVEAGPVLNLLTSGSARYQRAEGTFSSRADNEDLFRKRLSGIGWQGSLTANFQLLPKLDVGLGFNAYRQPQSGFEVAGAPTSTTYTLYGVRLGVKRFF